MMKCAEPCTVLTTASHFEPKYFAQFPFVNELKSESHILTVQEVRNELLHLYITIPIQLIELISDLEKQEKEVVNDHENKRYAWNRELFTNLLHNTQRIYQLFQSTEISTAQDHKEAIERDTNDVKQQMQFIETTSEAILKENDRSDDADFEFCALPIPVPNDDLTVILKELLNNAAHFSEKGKQIHIKTDIHDNAVRLVIKDHGEGMFETQVEELQSSFITSSEITNGLGLIIVKLLVQQYNGKIEVFSIPCRETVITLRFPLNSELKHLKL